MGNTVAGGTPEEGVERGRRGAIHIQLRIFTFYWNTIVLEHPVTLTQATVEGSLAS